MITELIKRPLLVLRHLPDRIVHAARRRRALERLGTQPVRSVVFICHGNINRSAYAAGRFVREIPTHVRDDMTVRSAGFIGPGRPASELATDIAAGRGINLSAHRSRLVDRDEMAGTDLIVVMSTAQRRDLRRLTGRDARSILILGDLDPHPIQTRTVMDPYGHPVHVFERVFDRIDRCIDQLATAMWPNRDRRTGPQT